MAYRHTEAAFGMHNLDGSAYVPGTSRFPASKEKEAGVNNPFRQALMITEQATLEFFTHGIKTFESKAPPKSSSKSKKNAQLDSSNIEAHIDRCALYTWLMDTEQPRVRAMFQGEPMKKFECMWSDGTPSAINFRHP
jgi:hypothetical protein